MANLSITDDEKAAVRTRIFHHLAGMVLVPTVKALWDRKVFEEFRNSPEPVSLDQIENQTHGNRGYLRVALRLLASCGWMQERREKQSGNISYSLTSKGMIGAHLAPHYAEAVSFIPKAIFLEDFLFGKSGETVLPSLHAMVARSEDHWNVPAEGDSIKHEVHNEVRQHLDGILVGPAMVALARGGILERLGQGPLEMADVSGNRASLSLIFDLLALQGWIAREQSRVWLTLAGHYASQIATSYGVTVSYLPLMNVLSTLLFGNPALRASMKRVPSCSSTGG